MKKRNVLKLIKSAAVIAGLGGSANAADTKSYPASGCHQVGTSGALGYYGGAIYNAHSTQDMDVICPLIHDLGNLTSATVYVFDRHQTENVTCTLHDELASGNDLYGLSQTKSSSGYGSNFQSMTYSSYSVLGVSPTMHRYATCRVPDSFNGAFSYVVSFVVTEA